MIDKTTLLEIAHYINKDGRMNCQQADTVYYAERPEFNELRDNEQLRRTLILALHYDIQVANLSTDIAQISKLGEKFIIEDACDAHKQQLVAQRDGAYAEYEYLRRLIDADNEYLKFQVTRIRFL